MTTTRSKKIIVKGKAYSSLSRAAEAYGLNYHTVWTRIKRGKTVEEALKKENEKYKKKITVGGKQYSSMRQASIAYGLEPRLVWSRLKKGKSLKEAFSVKPKKKLEILKA